RSCRLARLFRCADTRNRCWRPTTPGLRQSALFVTVTVCVLRQRKGTLSGLLLLGGSVQEGCVLGWIARRRHGVSRKNYCRVTGCGVTTVARTGHRSVSS